MTYELGELYGPLLHAVRNGFLASAIALVATVATVNSESWLIERCRQSVVQMEYVTSLVDKVVLVLTLDGRTIVGLLRGSDPMCNLVLEDSHERVFSADRKSVV